MITGKHKKGLVEIIAEDFTFSCEQKQGESLKDFANRAQEEANKIGLLITITL